MDELAELLSAEEQPWILPCRANPEAWFSLEPSEILEAIDGCQACPLFDPCDSFARATRPRAGVWAGKVWGDNGKPGVASLHARRIAAYAARVRGDAA